MNGLQDRCDDRIEKIWNDLRVRRDRVLKYEVDRDRERQRQRQRQMKKTVVKKQDLAEKMWITASSFW